MSDYNRLPWLHAQVLRGSQGTRYMTRLALTPPTRWGQLVLHFFHRPDEDPAPHTHPWDFWTLPLTATYWERVLARDGVMYVHRVPWMRWSYRTRDHAHLLYEWQRRGRVPLVTLVWRRAPAQAWGFWASAQEYGDMLDAGFRPRRLDPSGTQPTRVLLHWRDYLQWRRTRDLLLDTTRTNEERAA